MNLFNYLEKHGELENASSALAHFAHDEGNGIHSQLTCVFKEYTMVKGTTTSRVGQISFERLEVELHEGYDESGRKEEHRQTLLHETAHLIVQLIWDYGNKEVQHHGWQWKAVMRRLGVPADRCSNKKWMQDLRAAKATLIYACKSCGFEIPSLRARKMANRYHASCKHTPEGGRFYLKEDRRTGVQVDGGERKINKQIISRVQIDKAHWRNRYLKAGVYDMVRDFKMKKNSWTTGTISLLIQDQVVRVTVQEGWYRKV